MCCGQELPQHMLPSKDTDSEAGFDTDLDDDESVLFGSNSKITTEILHQSQMRKFLTANERTNRSRRRSRKTLPRQQSPSNNSQTTPTVQQLERERDTLSQAHATLQAQQEYLQASMDAMDEETVRPLTTATSATADQEVQAKVSTSTQPTPSDNR